jgi:hypothetical protein
VEAYDAAGQKTCGGTPKTCSSLWQYKPTYPIISEYPVISGTTLYVEILDFQNGNPITFQESLQAFDANGVNDCTALVCSPTWTTGTGLTSVPTGLFVGDGTAFVPGTSVGFEAFAANGSRPSALWSSSIAANPTAIGGSVLFASDGTNVYAFDAGGSDGCSASVCSPLWSTAGTDAIVANGIVYVSGSEPSGDGAVLAYGLS